MNYIDQLGVRKIINANASATRLGGSLLAPPVIEAMQEASSSYFNMYELQVAVSRRIAEITGNEAAFVCAGAAAGLFLSTLACMTGKDLRLITLLTEKSPEIIPKNEVIIHCGSRNPYDLAVKLAGAKIVQIGNVWQTLSCELEAAISVRTAAVLYLPGPDWDHGVLALEDVIRIAHNANVPVIVDAAAQLPPVENFWRYTKQGADLVVFSGGKRIRGPQSTGIILGRRELIDACALHASPNERLGRPMKVGKEEMVGLLAAIEWFLQQNESANIEYAEKVTKYWIDSLNELEGITAIRDFPGESGRLVPRALVSLSPELNITSQYLCQAMLEGEPAIDIAAADEHSIYLNAEMLTPGEEEIVFRKLSQLLSRLIDKKGI